MADFPPAGPTTLLKVIPSYLYQEYNDDDDLQAFVDSQNEITQGDVDWFVNINLPVYTSPSIAGPLLDLVAFGIYGMTRPALPSGTNRNIGPYNTWLYNQIAYNQLKVIGNQDYVATSDDIFKRILTWQLYKGDGKVFNIRWLKRRIMRFLFGANGTDPPAVTTYPISVTFGPANQVNINIGLGTRTVTGGALYNAFAYNQTAYNQLNSFYTPAPGIPTAAILKEAILSGAVELPFQFSYTVNTP